MARLPFYLVDAFVLEDSAHAPPTTAPAAPPLPPSGNPAAVVLLPPGTPPLSDATHAALAADFNQAETAFVRLADDGGNPSGAAAAHGLRWFTPTAEVPMCGHATLAAAAALVEAGKLPEGHAAQFDTLSGRLVVARPAGGEGGSTTTTGGGGGGDGAPGHRLEMELPARPPTTDALPACASAVVDAVLAGSGTKPADVAFNADLAYLAVEVAGGGAAIRSLAPQPRALLAATGGAGGGVSGVLVLSVDAPTAYLRFFGPWIGIEEDAATGSAAAVAAPWLAARGVAGIDTIRQLSPRGGSMGVALVNGGDTVRLSAGVRVVVAGEVRL